MRSSQLREEEGGEEEEEEEEDVDSSLLKRLTSSVRPPTAVGRSFLSRINSNETYIICFVPSRLAFISKIPLFEGNVALSLIMKLVYFRNYELR